MFIFKSYFGIDQMPDNPSGLDHVEYFSFSKCLFSNCHFQNVCHRLEHLVVNIHYAKTNKFVALISQPLL